MRLLIGLIVIALGLALGYIVYTLGDRALSGRRDNKRLKNERNHALEGLHNVREIVIPYTNMNGEAALLAEMVLSEIRKADTKLRKELQ